MAVTKDMLLSELQDLLRLTAFEQTIATVRRTQARTTALEEELTTLRLMRPGATTSSVDSALAVSEGEW